MPTDLDESEFVSSDFYPVNYTYWHSSIVLVICEKVI